MSEEQVQAGSGAVAGRFHYRIHDDRGGRRRKLSAGHADDLNQLVHVLPKPGVMDPVALSTLQALQDMSLPVEQVTTFRKYWLSDLDEEQLGQRVQSKLLSNDSIERVITGPLELEQARCWLRVSIRTVAGSDPRLGR